jgi:iron(III) transport system permease protein
MAADASNSTIESRRTRRPLGMWTVASVIIATLVATPLIALLVQALSGSINSLAHITSTVLPAAMLNTAILLCGVGILVAVIGTGTAWLVTAYDFRGRRMLEWALLLPLAVPTYIIAYAYLDILHPIGPVQSALRNILGYSSPQELRLPDIRSMTGCIILLGFVLYPYVYVGVRAMLLMQSANFIDVSRTLGISRRAVFWSVALPLARPAIAVGTSLALMETLNDIGASEFLGVRTLTVSVYNTWVNKTDLAGASQIALFMLLGVFLLVSWERTSRKNQRFANPAQRATKLRKHRLTGIPAAAAFAACIIPVCVGFLAPASYLLNAAWIRVQYAGVSERLLWEALTTISLAAVATAITLTLGIVVTYARRLRPGQLSKNSFRIATLGYAAPGTVVAIGSLIPLAALDQLIDSAVQRFFGFSTGLLVLGSGAALIYVYCVRFLTISAGSVESGFTRVSYAVDHAARSLGESPGSAFRTIHFPLTKPALAAAGLLLFVDCIKELPATLLLRPLNIETFATHLYAEAARGTYEEGAIAALSIVVIGIIPLVLLSRVGGKAVAQLR